VLRHRLQYPKTVGVRLEDGAKLRQLCDATQKAPGELLRTLIRLAQPIGLPPVQLAAQGKPDTTGAHSLETSR
jgi:hypothetical protein